MIRPLSADVIILVLILIFIFIITNLIIIIIKVWPLGRRRSACPYRPHALQLHKSGKVTMMTMMMRMESIVTYHGCC